MRDIRLYLEDILKATKNITGYVKDFDFEEFSDNKLVMDAVVRNLEIIGEAAKAIPSKYKNKYGDIEWRKMSGLRDVLIHQYFGVDKKVLWDIIDTKIPELKKNVNDILKEL